MNIDVSPGSTQTPIVLRLYVTGQTLSARRARDAVASLIESHATKNITLEVIDVLAEPDAATRDNVFATPTVIRVDHGSERRLIGDLSSKEKLEAGLDLERAPETVLETA